MATQRRDFDAVARTWDDNPARGELARRVAEAIAAAVPLDSGWTALDYGCGTGLVTLLLSPDLEHVVAADSSSGMLEVLAQKLETAGVTNVETRRWDLTTEHPPDERFDFIFSSMALHHMPDAGALVVALAGLLRSGGILAIADLDAEDGSFHGDTTGVFHQGFSEAQMHDFMAAAGLTSIKVTVAHVMRRPGTDGVTREYPVLLTVARKA